MEQKPTAKGQAPLAGTPGQLVIVSGPSGVGKSTVVAQVLERFRGAMRLSVSATTRQPRPGEVSGENYHFLSHSDFRHRLDADEFIEAIEVFGRGHWYGTLRQEVIPSLRQGVWVMLEIDVDGARRVLDKHPQAITIFIEPSSMQELERRLRQRRTDSEEAIQRRLAVAAEELHRASEYRCRVINDTVREAVDEVCSILTEQGLKPQEAGGQAGTMGETDD